MIFVTGFEPAPAFSYKEGEYPSITRIRRKAALNDPQQNIQIITR